MPSDQQETSTTFQSGPILASDQVTGDREAADSAGQSTVEPMWELIRRLPRYVRLASGLARDPRVPTSAKAMLAIGGAYLVSPIDLVPGLIPVAGQLDDLYVVLTGLQQTMRITPKPVVDEHLEKSGLTSQDISDDLAAIRLFVRKGVAWTFQKGGQAVAGISRQAVNLFERARTWGDSQNDQKPL
jgi:uncharacterized membrane protein YkvA (DUF1232 family)